MIELNSLTVVFMLEAIVAFFLMLLVFFLFSNKKSKGEHAASSEVIDKLQDTENIKAKKMKALISAHCNLDADVSTELLEQIKVNERQLYQQIIKIFLGRDINQLKKIDQKIDNLSEPYCKIISHASKETIDVEKVKAEEEKMLQLTRENERLVEQLTIAMSTMDEISAEYTRVFSGTQTELELENSSKKMFEIFRSAAAKVEQSNQSEGSE